MIIDGHTLPCYFADGFRKSTTKTPFILVWFSEIDIGLKHIVLYIHHIQQNLTQQLALKVQHILMYVLHAHKTPIILVFHVLKYFRMLKVSVVNLTFFGLHNTLIFL